MNRASMPADAGVPAGDRGGTVATSDAQEGGRSGDVGNTFNGDATNAALFRD